MAAMAKDAKMKKVSNTEAAAAAKAIAANAEPPRPIEPLFPMLVIPVSEALKMDKFPKHEDVKDTVLVEWSVGMGSVLFFSHTWLGYNHPDPDGIKWNLAKTLLQKALSGKLDILPHWTVEFLFGNLKVQGAELQAALKGGYIWCDFASVPQEDREAQGRAITSIASYVGHAKYFVCLAGPWKHSDGSVRDVRAWSGRAWCRLELAANMLAFSAASETRPLIVAESPSMVYSMGPMGLVGHGWIIDTVGKGALSVEGDRLKLGPVLHELIARRKAHALAAGTARELVWYRMLHAKTAYLLEGTGFEVHREETLDEWLRAMKFNTGERLHDDPVANNTGYTPFFLACVADRADLASQLLDHKCDIDARIRKIYPEFQATAGQNAYGACSFLLDSPEMLRLLLARGANPRFGCAAAEGGFSALDCACLYGRTGNIDALLSHDPTLFTELSHTPIGRTYAMGCAVFMSQTNALTHLATHYPDLFHSFLDGKFAAGKEVGGLSIAQQAVACTGDPQALKLLLDTGKVDVNLVGTVTPNAKLFYTLAGVLSKLKVRGTPSHFVQTFKYAMARASALHNAAFHGNLGAVELLLAAKADVHSTVSAQWMQPLHLAAMGGHDAVVLKLLAAGADPGARVGGGPWGGATPAGWAKRRGHAELAATLRAKAAAGKFRGGGGSRAKYQVAPARV